MHFTDPAGVDQDNRVTAREFADFCRRYIALHPEALEELHSLREFDYPLPQNMPGARRARLETKKQYNGNWLVWDGIGVDGLKTGHLDDENFTAAITARRGGMRLIAVLLGVPGSSLTDGARNRTDDSMALLTWGFRSFTTIDLDAPTLPAARVWKGELREIQVEPAGTGAAHGAPRGAREAHVLGARAHAPHRPGVQGPAGGRPGVLGRHRRGGEDRPPRRRRRGRRRDSAPGLGQHRPGAFGDGGRHVRGRAHRAGYPARHDHSLGRKP